MECFIAFIKNPIERHNVDTDDLLKIVLFNGVIPLQYNFSDCRKNTGNW
jgi:hypothetical protein